jgi:tetratricopeptide (TPR) repeat protein
MRNAALWTLLGLLSTTGLAAAEDPKPAGKAAADKGSSDKATSTVDVAANGIRRDPRGVQGISPMWEAIGKGDSAVLARDYDAAISAYREAITKSPQNPLPHYRMAEAQKLRGDLKEAEASYDSALRFAAQDATMKAKVLFCLADLSERQKDWDQALERWTAYETFAKSAEKAKLYPASAADRKKRILDWKQNSADSAEVKTRIEKRLKEADEKAVKDANENSKKNMK